MNRLHIFARLVFAYVSAPTISSVSRAISSGGIADGRSVESAAAGFASVLVSSVIASPEQILRFEQRYRSLRPAIPPADYMPSTPRRRIKRRSRIRFQFVRPVMTPIDRRG